jgi:hypothetical protein
LLGRRFLLHAGFQLGGYCGLMLWLQGTLKAFKSWDEEPTVQELVCLGSSMGLEINEEDVWELVEDHRKELSFEGLVKLHDEEAESLQQRIAFGNKENKDKEKSHSIQAEDLKKVLPCWNKLPKLMKDYHLDIGTVEMGLNHFNDTLMAHFWRVQKSRIKWSNLDSIFKKVDKCPPTDDYSPSTCMRFFIRESLFIVFTKERLFMLFKFTHTVYKY